MCLVLFLILSQMYPAIDQKSDNISSAICAMHGSYVEYKATNEHGKI